MAGRGSWEVRLLAVVLAVFAHLALLASFMGRAASFGEPPRLEEAGAVAMLDLAPGLAATAPSIATPLAPIAPETPNVAEDPPATRLIPHPEDLGLPAPRTDIAPVPVATPPLDPSLAALVGLPDPDPCRLTEAMRGGLEGDSQVRDALALIPTSARSVANAVMFWDGGWVPVGSLAGDGGLAPIRGAIVRSLQSVSDVCQQRVNIGPILVAVVEPEGTTVLAVGSGPWRVADLIAQPYQSK